MHDHQLTITQAEYQGNVWRHAVLSSIIIEEDNDAMTRTYLMVNPEGCFYQNLDAGCGYIVSDSILSAGVKQALSQVLLTSLDLSSVISLFQLWRFKRTGMTIQIKKYDVIPKHIQRKAWREIYRLKDNENKWRK